MFTYGTYYQRKHSPCCTNTELLRGPPGACCKSNSSDSNEAVELTTTVAELSNQVKQLTNLITLPIIEATEKDAPKKEPTLSDQVSALRNQVSNLTTKLETMTLSNKEQVQT
jgi:hypothetical protein